MPKYFRYFPEITYKGRQVKDITRRVRFLEQVQTDPRVFLPYTVKEGETADEIAYHYYGSANYAWLVFIANNIIDPYYDWPMTQAKLDAFISDKYRSLAEESEGTTLSDRQVLEWTQNATISDNIAYYYNLLEPEIRLSRDSYGIGFDPDFEAADWTPIRYYDYEFFTNEDKRQIFLVDREFAPSTEKELKSILNV